MEKRGSAYIGKNDRLAIVQPMLRLVKKEWADFLVTPVSEDEISDMRKHERTGRPLCTSWFLGQLEEHGFDRSPAEGNEEELREFFNNIKARWKVRKRELADKGIVGAED